jgi:hypothetical protein
MTTNAQSVLRFDPGRRASDGELRHDIAALISHLEAEERRLQIRQRERRDDRRRDFRRAAEALACNLAFAAMVSQTATLSVPRAHSAMWGRGRYRNPVYGQHFLSLIDLLYRLGLAEEVTHGRRFPDGSGQLTTIRPTPALRARLRTSTLKLTAFRQEEEPEVLILKPAKDQDGRAEPIDYKETDRTARLRREVKRLNAWLRDAPISIIDEERATIALDTDGQPIEPYRRNLRRIFNNADWQQGGRLFGGFWMTMERASRFRLLRVMDEPVANVDYSSLFPRLAYVRARQGQPEADLYDVMGDGSSRDGWKQLTNALLFASKPLRQWPSGTRALFPEGMSLGKAVAAVKAKHPAILHLFERGFGFELMRIESDMSVALVTHLFKIGITALPLHDSVLVARSRASTAKALMEEMFKARTRSPCAYVKIEFSQ